MSAIGRPAGRWAVEGNAAPPPHASSRPSQPVGAKRRPMTGSARAGTHNHQCPWCAKAGATALSTTGFGGFGSARARGRHRETCSFAPTRRLFEIESGRELRQRYPSKNPPVCCQTGGPDASVIASLPVLQHVLILQAPVLPQLQGGQQDHESAETRMPESQHAIVGIAEDVGRGD